MLMGMSTFIIAIDYKTLFRNENYHAKERSSLTTLFMS